jgi:Flp pilus assembly protein TadD
MACKQLRPVAATWAVTCIALALLCVPAFAEATLRIPIPRRDKPTPVQKLNAEGVKAIQKHQFDKAKSYFYHAYLLDPDDPFTLNNLGYISELQGDVERAQRYYELAEQNSTGAIVAKSNVAAMKGQPFSEAVQGVKSGPMQANRMNVEAMRLLSHGRLKEADTLLQQALSLNPHDPFTLNNLGYTKESEGELKEAERYYQAAAQVNAKDPVIVTVNPSWRGHPISKIAARNAKAVESELRKRENSEQQVARLNLRGVTALNRNDAESARHYFEQAYKLNPEDGFTLNNMGYVAELQGDRETADEFYAKARRAQRANDKVTFSNQREMQGLKLGAVAGINDQKIETTMEANAEARRRLGGPIQLKRRNGAAVTEPETVPQRPPGSEQAPEPQAAPSAEPQAQPAPQAPSPFSPEPPKMPAPQMPQPSTQPPAPATQPPQSMAPASGQPTQPPPAQPVPQTSSPNGQQSSGPVTAPVTPSPQGQQQAQPSQPAPPMQPPQNAPQGQSTTPPSTVQPPQ